MGTKFIPHSDKREVGVHMLTTEAQTLEQAARIIKERHRHEKQAKTLKGHKPTTLHAISVLAANQAKFKVWRKEHPEATVHPKTPHPYRDLPEDQKPIKMREMYYSHAFGYGVKAHRDLSKKFGVSYDTAVEWIDDKINSVYAEGENYNKLAYEARERYRRLERYRADSKRIWGGTNGAD